MLDEIIFHIKTKPDGLRVVNGRRTVYTLQRNRALYVQGLAGMCVINALNNGWVEVRVVPGLFLRGQNIVGQSSFSIVVREVLNGLELLGVRGWVRPSWRVIAMDITGWIPLKLVKGGVGGCKHYDNGWLWKGTNGERVTCYGKAAQLGVSLPSLKGWRRIEVGWVGQLPQGLRLGRSVVKQLAVWVNERLPPELRGCHVLFNPPFAFEAAARHGFVVSPEFGKVWIGNRTREVSRANAAAKKQGKFFQLQSACVPEDSLGLTAKDPALFVDRFVKRSIQS